MTSVTIGYQPTAALMRRRVGKQRAKITLLAELSFQYLSPTALFTLLEAVSQAKRPGCSRTVSICSECHTGVEIGAAGYDWRFEGEDILCLRRCVPSSDSCTTQTSHSLHSQEIDPESLLIHILFSLTSLLRFTSHFRPLPLTNTSTRLTTDRRTWHLHSLSSQLASHGFLP